MKNYDYKKDYDEGILNDFEKINIPNNNDFVAYVKLIVLVS
jgi:hypothetical protein